MDARSSVAAMLSRRSSAARAVPTRVVRGAEPAGAGGSGIDRRLGPLSSGRGWRRPEAWLARGRHSLRGRLGCRTPGWWPAQRRRIPRRTARRPPPMTHDTIVALALLGVLGQVI